jgi:hypothetical protein
MEVQSVAELVHIAENLARGDQAVPGLVNRSPSVQTSNRVG